MLSDIWGGIRLAARRWKYCLGIAMIFATVALIMSLILGDVLTQARALEGGKNIRQAHAVVFTPVYPPGKVTERNQKSLDMLCQKIAAHEAYSSVINNVAVNDSDVFNNTPTILVIGNAVFDFFPSLGPGCQAPCVLRGALLPPDDKPVEFRGISFPQGGLLSRGATWFDANASGLNIDTFQMLVLSPQQVSILDEYEQEELLTKAVFLAPSNDFLNDFIDTTKEGGLYLIPSDLAKDQPKRFSDLMTKAALYVISLLAFSILAFFAYSASVRELIKQEARAFVIRQFCGASPPRLAIRLLVFLALSTLVVPLSMCALLWMAGPPMEDGAKVMIIVLLLIYLCLATSAMFSVQKEGTTL